MRRISINAEFREFRIIGYNLEVAKLRATLELWLQSIPEEGRVSNELGHAEV